MAEELLTYRELAERLGIKPESARKTVQRRRWKRVPGNDGVTRVIVPHDYLDSPADSPSDTSQASQLQVENARLAASLAAETRRADTAEQDRDRWHALAVRPWWKRLAG